MKCEDGTFTLSKEEIRALSAYVSTDTTRPYMNKVEFDLNQGRASATDGHTACIAQCDVQQTLDTHPVFYVGLDRLEQVARDMKRNEEVRLSEFRDGVVTISNERLRYEFGGVSASKFPNIDHVIPDPKRTGGNEVKLNTDYLVRIERVAIACALKGSVNRVVTINLGDKYDPVLLRMSSVDRKTEWTVLVMPTR